MKRPIDLPKCDEWTRDGTRFAIYYDRHEDDVTKFYHYFAPEGCTEWQWATEMSPYRRDRKTFEDHVNRKDNNG